jgi:hypothetical protein
MVCGGRGGAKATVAKYNGNPQKRQAKKQQRVVYFTFKYGFILYWKLIH